MTPEGTPKPESEPQPPRMEAPLPSALSKIFTTQTTPPGQVELDGREALDKTINERKDAYARRQATKEGWKADDINRERETPVGVKRSSVRPDTSDDATAVHKTPLTRSQGLPTKTAKPNRTDIREKKKNWVPKVLAPLAIAAALGAMYYVGSQTNSGKLPGVVGPNPESTHNDDTQAKTPREPESNNQTRKSDAKAGSNKAADGSSESKAQAANNKSDGSSTSGNPAPGAQGSGNSKAVSGGDKSTHDIIKKPGQPPRWRYKDNVKPRGVDNRNKKPSRSRPQPRVSTRVSGGTRSHVGSSKSANTGGTSSKPPASKSGGTASKELINYGSPAPDYNSPEMKRQWCMGAASQHPQVTCP